MLTRDGRCGLKLSKLSVRNLLILPNVTVQSNIHRHQRLHHHCKEAKPLYSLVRRMSWAWQVLRVRLCGGRESELYMGKYKSFSVT